MLKVRGYCMSDKVLVRNAFKEIKLITLFVVSLNIA